jgi:hypothetical protein
MASENIVGPFGTGVNETTTRPDDPDSGSSVDTWFQPCVGGEAGTGTKVPAVWLNKVTALFRRAIRGMGIPDDSQDDDMLLKAIQKAVRGIKSIGVAGAIDIQVGVDSGDNTFKIRKIRGVGITFTVDPTNGEIVATVGGDAVTLAGLAPVLQIEQRRANLVTAPALTQNAWTTRPLTNVTQNQITDASLSGSQIILPAGTYRCEFLGMAAMAGHHRTRLQNVTDANTVGYGCSADSYTSTGGNTVSATLNPSIGIARFTIADVKVFELQTYATNGSSPGTSRMGDANDQDIGSGNFHVDGWIEIIKEA